MSVNANWSETPWYQEVKDFPKDDPQRNEFYRAQYTVMMALVGCRFPTDSGGNWAITEKNWKKVFMRLHTWEHLFGAFRQDRSMDGPPKDIWITPKEVHSLVGMTVNAGTETDTQFKKHVWEIQQRQAQDALNAYERLTSPG